MAVSTDELDRQLDDLKSDFSKFVSRFERLEQKIEELHREAGARQGRDLYQQIDNIEKKVDTFAESFAKVERETHAIRKLQEYGDIRLKEIMKALSLIYKNTDELEETLLDAENIQTR